MISKKMEDAINNQINNEMYSAYLYMAMAAYSDSIGLPGFAKWFMVQYHEEMAHAMKMYEYLQSRGGTVKLGAIKKPPQTWKSPADMFEQTYKHEQFITGCISDLMDLAQAEKDRASEIFYQWYVTEQVEEEENDTAILAKLKLIGNGTNGLLMLDNELGARAVAVPTDFSLGVNAQMKNA